jgi:hypothetical protein
MFIYNFAATVVGIFYWYDWKITVGIELLVLLDVLLLVNKS